MKPLNLKRQLRSIYLSILVGLLAGTSSAIFLHLLELSTRFRILHSTLIYFLPLAGLLSGLTYHHFGRSIEGGHNLILDEIHNPKNTIPARMAPMVLLGTLLTHLFGGSAGREGTAVQMSASLADQLSLLTQIEPNERKILLVAGAGAGFGAAIGAPFAGVLFGMEVIYISGIKFFAVFECLIASFVGYSTSLVLHAPHTHYPTLPTTPFDLKTVFSVVLASLGFGLTAVLFIKLTHTIENAYKKLSIPPWVRPFLGGSVVVILYQAIGTYRYAGLSIPIIQESLAQATSFFDPILKGIFTALTVGSGFKGGEFIPLVVMGSSLGSALSHILPVSAALLGSLGFAAVFGAATNTPLTCTVMAIEIFGLPIAPYALIACLVSYACSGDRSIYRGQKLDLTKKAH